MGIFQRLLILAAVGVAVCATGSPGVVWAEEPAAPVQRELLARLQKLDFDDAAAVYELAEWADDRDLSKYSHELYRRTLDADPLHEPALRRLREVAAEQGLVDDQPLRDELREELPGRFRLHESEHFLIMHDTEREAARERAKLLERTRQVFYDAFEEAGLPMRPLRQRLVVILFAERDAFERYARETDGVDREWSLGHYAPRSNRIAFFDEAGGSELERYTERVIAVKGQIRTLVQAEQAARGTRAERLRQDLAEARSELALLRSRRDRLAEATDTARTAHEASHQLAYNSGLLRRGVVYPVWLLEGMATQFEPPDAQAPFGPGVPNRYRRSVMADMLQRDALIPLQELVTRVELPADRETARDLYAQSYMLFGYLLERDPAALRDYLADLYTHERGRRDEAALRRAFVEAFGDVDELQREFETHLRSLN